MGTKIEIEIGENLCKAICKIVENSELTRPSFVVEEAFHLDLTKIAKTAIKRDKSK